MMADIREGPAGLLTRHFFAALFDFGVLTQEGADAFVRVVIGLISLLFSLGLLLVYLYMKKYAALSAAPDAGPYAQALLADTTLAIALPMWIVASVTVLVSHSLFPDDTDFRVLMPLPVSRRLIFGAKLLALAGFAGLFTTASQLAVTPLVMRISASRWAVDPPPLSVLAFWPVCGLASVFALLSIVALNGVLIVCMPRHRVHALSAAMRSLMLGGLVLALPFVTALPAQSHLLAHHSRLFFLVPPAWFTGFDRVLLGHRDPYFVRLAEFAMGALILAASAAIAGYLAAYRRFDRPTPRWVALTGRPYRARAGEPPVRAAIRDFTAITLRRSSLQQGVLIGVSACGVALAVNSLVRSGVLGAVSWTPFPLIALLGIAARTSLALPVEPKANWVFRMTDCGAVRLDQLHAVERMFTLFAACVPAALTLPLQWIVAGRRALLVSALTGACGLLWAEALLRDWRRIPFTCSYLPGKHPVAQSSLAAVTGFLAVSTLGSGLNMLILRGTAMMPVSALVITLCSVFVAVRRTRRRKWHEMPLAFDDELPSDVQLLQACRN